ncbi:MAG: T9SS type A sorting domain-containing protein [Dysgonomonas sp.]
MKRKFTILSFALLAYAGSSFAQTNLIQQGDFEEPSIETFVYENHTCPVYVPGWDFKEDRNLDNLDPSDFNNNYLNKWSVRAEMLYEEAPEDNNYQHIRLQRYEWQQAAGWIDWFGLDQTVTIKPGTDYTLTFNYRINPGQDTTTGSGFNEADGFATIDVPAAVVLIIPDMPDSIIPLTARAHANWDKTDINKNWDTMNLVYKTPNNVDKMTVRLAVKSGQVYSWGGNINMWMDIDNVSLVEGSGSSISVAEAQNVKISSYASTIYVKELVGNNTVSVYSTSGQLIKSITTSNSSLEIPILQKGIYIVKVGTKSAKVII